MPSYTKMSAKTASAAISAWPDSSPYAAAMNTFAQLSEPPPPPPPVRLSRQPIAAGVNINAGSRPASRPASRQDSGPLPPPAAERTTSQHLREVPAGRQQYGQHFDANGGLSAAPSRPSSRTAAPFVAAEAPLQLPEAVARPLPPAQAAAVAASAAAAERAEQAAREAVAAVQGQVRFTVVTVHVQMFAE